MNLINIYIYKFTNDNLEIKDFFSDYRLLKIKNSNNKTKEIQIEYVIKNAIEHFSNTSIKRLEFKINQYGKPILINLPYYINITHSNEYLIVGVSNSNLGIDLEYINNQHLKLSKRLFIEQKEYTINEVISTYTIKEAYIKYYGRSILYDLKKITFNNNKVSAPLGDLYYKNYLFNNYYLSIVSKLEFSIKSYSIKDLKDLIKIEESNIISKSNEKEE